MAGFIDKIKDEFSELKEQIEEMNNEEENPFLTDVKKRAAAQKKRIVLCEGEDARAVKAASMATKEGIAKIVLLGDEEQIKKDNPDLPAFEEFDEFLSAIKQVLG